MDIREGEEKEEEEERSMKRPRTMFTKSGIPIYFGDDFEPYDEPFVESEELTPIAAQPDPPNPKTRPISVAQVIRQTYFKKRTPKSFCYAGVYEVDLSDPIPRLRNILSRYPKNFDFGFTKDSYFAIPNAQSVLSGPASGTRSHVKYGALHKNPEPAGSSAAADAHASRRN